MPLSKAGHEGVESAHALPPMPGHAASCLLAASCLFGTTLPRHDELAGASCPPILRQPLTTANPSQPKSIARMSQHAHRHAQTPPI